MIDHGENAEFVTVRLIFATKNIRLTLAYGPQKTDLGLRKKTDLGLRSLSRNFMADIRISLRNIGGQSMQW